MNVSIRLTIVFIIFLLFLPKEACQAQQDYTVEHFTTDQGLSDQSVRCIFKDHIGYLWIGTSHGLCRFDGIQFKTFLQTSFVGNGLNFCVNCICEDKEGNLWIGTYAGLNKYNRINDMFTTYPLPDDTTGQVDQMKIWQTRVGVITMAEDKNGNLWIGTKNGLYNFNTRKRIFTYINGNSNEHNTLSCNIISVIYNDNAGKLWIGTGDYLQQDGGLNLFESSTGIFKQFVHDPLNSKSLTNNWITAIYQDRQGNLWIGTGEGLDRFDIAKEVFNHVRYNNPGVSDDQINGISGDNNGNIFLVTWAGGIYKYNMHSGKCSTYSIKSGKDRNINVISLYDDNSGIVWVGTSNNGLFKITPRTPGVIRLQNSVKNAEKIRNKFKGDFITSICRSNEGIIWIGTGHNGVNSINPDFTIGSSFLNNIKTPGNSVYSVFEDKMNKLWVGTSGGLYTIDLKTKMIRKYVHNPKDQNSLGDNQITAIVEDNDGTIWLGTYDHGIEKYDREKGTFKHIQLNAPVMVTYSGGETVHSMLIDSRGYLWLTAKRGIARFDRLTETFKWYVPDSGDTSSQWFPYADPMFEDHNHLLWFGTVQGIVCFDRESGTFTHYTESDGLADGRITAILEDKHGNLWLSTPTGISKFNRLTKRFTNFGKIDGIDGWHTFSACQDSSGDFYFGRGDGITIFNPDSLYIDNPTPKIVLTGFNVVGEPTFLDSSISVKKNIELNYQQNKFLIEFAALSYVNSYKNQYAYKLEGFDKDWIYCGTRHQVTYTNLNAGTYTFRVIGSNYEGVWSEPGASVLITISPPWWKTTWAYISYGLIFILILYSLRRYELNRVELKDRIRLDQAVLNEREETDKMKSRFFANISHEFRTPLTLILGPAEKINSQTSGDVIKDSGIIKRNSKRLLQLVNQLLDLSRLEAGKLKLEATKGNIVSFVKGIILSFESLSEEKDITLKIYSEKDLIEAYFDREKMIKILSNILSNSFKFTPQGGKITISITESHAEPALPAGRLVSHKGVLRTVSNISGKIPDQVRNDKLKNNVEIKISDTGIGIAKEEIPKLFDRFYQVDSSFAKEYEGTGIGLALTKELVELHHGNIGVQSEEGKWTEFTLNLPLGRDHLRDEEIVQSKKKDKTKDLMKEDYYFIDGALKERGKDVELDSLKDEKNIVLVVEDNYDMREYIKESLGEDYYVEEAVNGEQGIRKAEEMIPDLIISDMMMPKMDGSEMTRILKNDEKTSHIPIIILTAKSGQESKLEGLETGADDYLTKPFDIKELQVRIRNLIKLRKKLQEKLSRIEMDLSGKKGNETKSISVDHIKLRSIDEKFIDKIQKIIEGHISDEDFSTEELGSEVGMSRSQVFRKIKALTGKSPSVYVRYIRLLKAKGMIENGDGNISEIAYSVGFSSPPYFTRCFREEFGYPPKKSIL